MNYLVTLRVNTDDFAVAEQFANEALRGRFPANVAPGGVSTFSIGPEPAPQVCPRCRALLEKAP